MARRRGDGSIYRRSDGRYEAAVYLRTSGGTRKRVRFYVKSYAEARAALANAIVNADRGHAVPGPDVAGR